MRPGMAGLTMPGTVERGMRKFTLPLTFLCAAGPTACSTPGNFHGQGLQPADRSVGLPPRLRFHRFHRGNLLQQGAEGDFTFQLGQPVSQTVMDTLAESQAGAIMARHVEAVGIGILHGITVGGAEETDDVLSGRNDAVTQCNLLGRTAADFLDRALLGKALVEGNFEW